MSRAVLALGCVLTAGCTQTHLDTNAPGHIDPLTRPRTPEDREPRDPGRQHVVLAYGAMGGGGAQLTGPSTKGFGEVGGEVSVFYGRDDQPPAEGSFYGGSVGTTILASAVRDAHGGRVDPGPELYGELALRRETVFGLGAGWAVDASHGATGPQVTMNVGPLFVRGTHMLGDGTFLVVGLVIKGQHTWTWSR